MELRLTEEATLEIELVVAAEAPEMECELMVTEFDELLCAYCWSLWQKPRQLQWPKRLQQFLRRS